MTWICTCKLHQHFIHTMYFVYEVILQNTIQCLQILIIFKQNNMLQDFTKLLCFSCKISGQPTTPNPPILLVMFGLNCMIIINAILVKITVLIQRDVQTDGQTHGQSCFAFDILRGPKPRLFSEQWPIWNSLLHRLPEPPRAFILHIASNSDKNIYIAAT